MEPLQGSLDQLVPVESRFPPWMGMRASTSTAAATSYSAATSFGLGQSQAPWVVRVLVGVQTFVGDLENGAIFDAELQLLQNCFTIQTMGHRHCIANALLWWSLFLFLYLPYGLQDPLSVHRVGQFHHGCGLSGCSGSKALLWWPHAKNDCKPRKHVACAVAPPPPLLRPLSADYPLSWGRTESPSEAEYEQHGNEQLTIAQTTEPTLHLEKPSLPTTSLLARWRSLAGGRGREERSRCIYSLNSHKVEEILMFSQKWSISHSGCWSISMHGQVQFNSSTIRLINGTQANSQQVVEDDHSLQDVKLVLKIINMWAAQNCFQWSRNFPHQRFLVFTFSLSFFQQSGLLSSGTEQIFDPRGQPGTITHHHLLHFGSWGTLQNKKQRHRG